MVGTDDTWTTKGLGCLIMDIEGVTRVGIVVSVSHSRALRQGVHSGTRYFGCCGRILFSYQKQYVNWDVVHGRGSGDFIFIWSRCIDCTIYHFSTLRKERAKTVAGARSLKHVCSRE